MDISTLMLVVTLHSPVVHQDIRCLASVIFHEARGESIEGQKQVAQVVINRTRNPHYPDSICKVAFQKDQFTGLNHIEYDRKAYFVASSIYTKLSKSEFPNATHYHTVEVNPHWNKWNKLQRAGVIGNHIFYEMKGFSYVNN